jgi:hypothetical protein
MLYDAMEQLAGGVTAVQARLMALEEAVVAVNPVGAEGTAPQLPPPPLCVSALAWFEAADAPYESSASTR